MAETETAEASVPPLAPPEEIINGIQDQTTADIQNHPEPTSSSDSGSESDSDSDDEAQEDLLIQTLKSQLSADPSNYDAHIQYIRALRKKGDIEMLRQARESMYEIFPLTPQMWQEWTKDEISLGTGPKAFAAIEEIFERGLSDYLSIPLWCDYLNFALHYDPSICEFSSTGISKARNIFERALTAAGLHVAEGHKIWEAYREFEQAFFYTINEKDTESKEKQLQRIRNTFQRQLSVPLRELNSTLIAYKAWEVEQGNTLDVNSISVEGIPPLVASAYQKALEALNTREHYEEQISRDGLPDLERHQQFLKYLKFEESSGDPARSQILYERAITEFPISKDIWLDYTRYLDKTLKTSSIIRDVYKRATRNCPHVGELWVCFLLSLERGQASEEEISAVFEKSLQYTFSSFDEYLDIFLTRVDGLRRRISAGETEGALDYAMIRNTFQRAHDYLSPHLKDTDMLLKMHSYWARLESNLVKDVVAARGVWESLLKISGSMLEAWLGYITMEVETGHVTEARSLYKRCYCKRFPGTGSEDICRSWLRFEREFATLEDYDRAVHKVTPRLEELQSFKLHQDNKDVTSLTNPNENLVKKPRVVEKRKPASDLTDEQSPAKRQKDTAQKSKERSSIQLNKREDAKLDAIKPDRTSGRVKQYNDQCTAFISNLSLKATYEDLRRFFNDAGGVTSIRILNDKFTGKSRGLAYVDFSDETHLAAAIAKNKQQLLGKKLSIARSDPKQSKTRGSAQRGSSSEHGHSEEHTSPVGRPSNSAASNKDRDSRIHPKGNITFARPRIVNITSRNEPKPVGKSEGNNEQPKSNKEFRDLLLKE